MSTLNIWYYIIIYNYCTCTRSIWGFMERSTTILNSASPRSILSDFNDISYVGRLWCPELIPDIEQFLAVAIFKMAATIPHKFNIVRFQMSGINSGHHNLPTYEISLKSNNGEFLRYCGGNFENGDRYKFFDGNFICG
jgi:hypothetical protein